LLRKYKKSGLVCQWNFCAWLAAAHDRLPRG
jgi:hypothetical protein